MIEVFLLLLVVSTVLGGVVGYLKGKE